MRSSGVLHIILQASRRAVTAAAVRPTLLAQCVAALGALALTIILTRGLVPRDFAIYSTIIAACAFGNALVGTTIGTRSLEVLAQHADVKIPLTLSRDAPPLLLCLAVVAGTATLTATNLVVALVSVSSMCGFLVTELANADLLGTRRPWHFVILTIARTVVWDVAALCAVLVLPANERLLGVLAAVVLAGCVPGVYLVACRRLMLSRAGLSGQNPAISAVGVTALSLWLLASADRVILARIDLGELAVYVAIYGLLDRVFRTVTNGEVQHRLPRAFRAALEVNGGLVPRGWSIKEAGGLIILGVASVLLGPSVVSMLSGGTYHPSRLLCCVLGCAMVAMVVAVPWYVRIVATGRARRLAVLATGIAIVNIAGNLVWDPRHGIMSAAVLTCAGYVSWLCGTMAIARSGSHAGVALVPVWLRSRQRRARFRRGIGSGSARDSNG